MPNQTSIYRLPYIYATEPITEPMERIRYQTLDAQIESLFTFLGDGIITGWEINLDPNDADGKTIILTAGSGVIASIAAATSADTIIDDLSFSAGSDTDHYVYIQSVSNTPQTAIGRITTSITAHSEEQYLLLGKVTVDENGKIKSIDTSSDSGRQELTLLRYLLESISSHVHSSAPGEPDKIDLTNHVKGILSAANIEDLPASKITSGTFGPSVQAPVAMGYVENSFSKIDTKVFLEVRGKKYPAIISNLPFYKKSYVKGASK